MKAYTDLEQSKKLVEILPLESADMYWFRDNVEVPCMYPKDMMKDSVSVTCPCWSLVALLNAVDFSTINLHYDKARTDWIASATIYDSTKHCTKYEITRALNPIDTCYEMICLLKEKNLL